MLSWKCVLSNVPTSFNWNLFLHQDANVFFWQCSAIGYGDINPYLSRMPQKKKNVLSVLKWNQNVISPFSCQMPWEWSCYHKYFHFDKMVNLWRKLMLPKLLWLALLMTVGQDHRKICTSPGCPCVYSFSAISHRWYWAFIKEQQWRSLTTKSQLQRHMWSPFWADG